MFTGIVTEMGIILATEASAGGRRLTFSAPANRPGMRIGDSIAVNGVCLTAVTLGDGSITVEAVAETLQRTNLGGLGVDDPVDLERPMPGDGRFDGHIVQGHVDGVGTVVSLSAEGTATRMRITFPAELARYVVEKGSVTVDGVSLTVTAVAPVAGNEAWFEIVLIPHTLEVTVLGRRRVGDRVNLEVDVIAKYVERLIEAHR